MKTLLRYEFKKILDKKTLLICLLFFIVNISIITFSTLTSSSYQYDQGYQQIAMQIDGRFNQDSVDFLNENYHRLQLELSNNNESNPQMDPSTYTGYTYGDMHVFEELLNDYERMYTYQSTIDNMITIVNENIELNEYNDSYNNLLLERLENRGITSYYSTKYFDNYFNYNISLLLVIVLCVFIGVQYLFYNQNTNMEAIIKSTPLGKKKINIISIFLYIVTMLFIAAIFFTSDYVIHDFLLHFDGLSNPIYSMSNYFNSYFTMNILSYIILNILLKVIGIVAFSSIIVLIIKISKNFFFTFLITIFIGIMLWLNLLPFISNIFYIPNIMIGFEFVRVNEFYIPTLYIVILVISLIFILSIFISKKVGERRYV